MRPYSFRPQLRHARAASRAVASFKEAVGSDEVLVLIDQEGGRVQRLQPPHWRNMPPARCYGRLYETDPELGEAAAFAGARLIAQELYDARHQRQLHARARRAAKGGARDHRRPRLLHRSRHRHRARTRRDGGVLAGGVLPVIKHVPGHGRAKADSHLALPRIDVPAAELDSVDFRPVSCAPRCAAGHDRPCAACRPSTSGDRQASPPL